MTSPRVVLIGAVDSTRVAFEALIEAQFALDLLITLPLDRSNMHSDYVDLKGLADAHDVPVVATANVNSDVLIDQVRSLRPDFIFVIGWSRLVGEALRSCATKGVLGFHPAPLPKGRGRSALAWTILLGMEETAGTLFWIDEGVDSGAIAAQSAFALSPRVDLPELYGQHIDALRTMFRGLLGQLKADEMPAVVQDESQATYFALRRPEDGLIDWTDSASAIDRLVRAVTRPYPGAFTTHAGRQVMIWRGERVEAPEWHAQAGQVFLIKDGALYVRCGNDTSFRVDEYEILGGQGDPPTVIKGQPRLGDIKGIDHA